MKRYELGNPVIAEYYRCSDVDEKMAELERMVDSYEKTIAFMSEKMNNQRRRLKHFEQKGQDNDTP